MSVRTYPQLDDETRSLLRQQVERLGSVGAVAGKLGYSRPAISGALHGTYVGNTDRLRSRIVEVFLDAIVCPHVGKAIAPDECRWWRTCPCPTHSNVAANHWLACKTCPNNPDRKELIP
ncbi:hypothetical protein ABE438_14610 [Bosea sp. TWI1241]|uniref:hypothetical protein n=1 Tax=Bosea sp. TWI1241 TaxID=3148904 RepID=UPI003207ED82